MEPETKLTGIPIVSGRGIGKAYFSGRPLRVTPARRITKDEVGGQIIQFNELREEATRFYEQNIRQMMDVSPAIQDASILNVYKQLLADPLFVGQIVEMVSRQLVDLETAIRTVAQAFITQFDSAQTAYFRERSGDMVEICEKLASLIPHEEKPVQPGQSIILIVPGVLTPSDLLKFDKSTVKGIVALNAGPTSHASILARTYEIPVVSGIKDLKTRIRTDDEVLVNGYEGTVVVHPGARLSQSLREERALSKQIKALSLKHPQPVHTKDGVPIAVMANAALPDDVNLAHAYGADEIGLVRSEYLYFMYDRLPSDKEQLQYFKDLFGKANGKELVIRLLDIGADKKPPQLGLPKEINPFIGWRGIRVLLKRKDIFKQHLFAIMQASKGRPYSIMIPMVTTLNEWKESRAVIHDVARELGVLAPRCGILLEVPLALLEAESFLPYVDFMSLGTNDLIQYLSAADRDNSNVAHLYNPIEPAFLRIMQKGIQVANRAGKPISICGEMGGMPLYTVLLLGLGLKRFSIVPRNIPVVKEIISRISFRDASEKTKGVLIHCLPEEMPARVVLLNKRVLGDAYADLEPFFRLS